MNQTYKNNLGPSPKLLKNRKYITAISPRLCKYILLNPRHFSTALPFYCSQNEIFNQIIPSTYKVKINLSLFILILMNLTFLCSQEK